MSFAGRSCLFMGLHDIMVKLNLLEPSHERLAMNLHGTFMFVHVMRHSQQSKTITRMFMAAY